MVGDDLVHDRQSQPGAVPLTGEVGKEEPFFVLGGDARPAVRDLHANDPDLTIERRGDPQRPLAVHRLDGIVEEVGEGSLELVGVGLDGGDVP